MKLKFYVYAWVLTALLLAYESWALNEAPLMSISAILRANVPELSTLDLNPAPGKTISLWYGWMGFSLMLLTNLYVFRKRFKFLSKTGNLPGWLDFHIFCGLLGPTFILFHTNFKIGGLVAISFWSMTIVFFSGIIGRYFYIQMAQQKNDLQQHQEALSKGIRSQLKLFNITITDPDLETIKRSVAKMAGLKQPTTPAEQDEVSLLSVIWNTLWGDLLLRFRIRKYTRSLPAVIRQSFREYAITCRRAGMLEQFRRIMGYWHTFHLPFSFFMYFVAAIHITVALLFQVKT